MKPSHPEDARIRAPRTLDDPVAAPSFATKEQWLKRRQALRTQVLVSTGLWPPPARTPLRSRVFGRVERDGYSIEKVYFESRPGFYVTGNLYRPLGAKGKVPGVLATHGHWANGRMANEELGSIPGRCISLARQGMVAFSYDMVGYQDSLQLPHTFAGDREALWGISLMGLQTWNSVRALDFLASLPDVDARRLAVTGESGGGTQTFLLTAVDDRPAVSCPVNMISLHMQGGCLCENAPGLRVGTSNVEIGALMAPKPMLMVAATGDWTVNTPKLEFPATEAIYGLLGAAGKVATVQIDAPHNNNRASREAMYTFFRHWLLGITDGREVKETPFTMDPERELRVFPDGKLPAGSPDEAALRAGFLKDAEERAAKLADPAWMARPGHRGALRSALAACLKAEMPRPADVEARSAEGAASPTTEGATHHLSRLVLSRRGVGDAVPVLLFEPEGGRRRPPVVVVASPGGAADLAPRGQPGPLVAALLARGRAVAVPDLFLTGASAEAARAAQVTRDTSKGYFTTYNATDTGERVQDLLTLAAYLRSTQRFETLSLAGTREAGLWVLLAAGLTPKLARVAADTDGFRSEEDEDYLKRLFVPSLRLVGDFATSVALAVPAQILLHNTQGRLGVDRLRAACAAAGEAGRVPALTEEPAALDQARLAAWLAPEE
ncbi:MAG TPA: acetylxylan esterase [Armatimonadota bacterium]